MEMVSEPAQALWRRLSIFAESASQEALEAVVSGEDLPLEEVTTLLSQLGSQEMLLVEQGREEPRYRIPEALHPEASRQLNEHGEAEDTFQQLVSYYISLAERMLEEAFGDLRTVWMQRLEEEHANLHAVLDELVKRGDTERGLQLAYLWQELWFEESHTSEGREWFARLLAQSHPTGSDWLRARVLDLAGALALNQGDYSAARSLQEEGLSILRRAGEPTSIAYALMHLGHLAGLAQGDFVTARSLYQEARDLLDQAQHAEGMAHARANLATIAILEGDYAAARSLTADSLRRYQELGDTYSLVLSIWRAAGVAAGSGRPERALLLAGASSGQSDAIGVSQPEVFQARRESMLEPARRVLDPSRQASLWEEGQTLTLEQAIASALEELTLPASP